MTLCVCNSIMFYWHGNVISFRWWKHFLCVFARPAMLCVPAVRPVHRINGLEKLQRMALWIVGCVSNSDDLAAGYHFINSNCWLNFFLYIFFLFFFAPYRFCFSHFPQYIEDPNNRVAPSDPPNHRTDGTGYTITPKRLEDIRKNFLYWFFDKGGNNDNGDYQRDIHASNPQLHKNFNFQLPFYGFRFNYTRVR